MPPLPLEPQPCGWVLMSEPWEIMPNDDIGTHISGMRCHCRPRRDAENTIVHNSYDGREDFETGKRKFS